MVLAPVSRPEAGMATAVPAVMEGPPVTRTIEIQTDFRESETQTDPWSPEYVTMPGYLTLLIVQWLPGIRTYLSTPTFL